MSMPKGHKSENGYATVTSIEGAKDYRTIAQQMTEEGHKMNHATARNVFLRAMKKIAEPLHNMYDMPVDEASIMRTAKDPRFQESVFEIAAASDSSSIEM